MDTDKYGFFKLKSASVRIFSRAFLFLCAFFPIASVAFAQNGALTRAEIDFSAQKIALEKSIRSGDSEEKREALRVIRNLETPEASRLTLPALKDKSEIVRATAASSIVFLPAGEAVPALLPLLNDKKEFVRKEAAYALGKTRSPLAAAPLVDVLRKDKRLEVKGAAIVALGETGDSQAVSALITVLRTNQKAQEEFLRRAAARSIGQIAQIIQNGTAKVVTPENFILETNRIRGMPKYARLTESFPAFGSAAEVLIQALQNAREASDVRREAAFALGAIGDESALPALRANLNAEDYFLAQISREAVEKILNNQAILNSEK